MKKCLLFIFVFGITFSLWNIKAYAYSDAVNNAGAVIVYKDHDGNIRLLGFSGNTFTFDTYYSYYRLRNNGFFLGYSQPTSSFNSIADAIAYTENVDHWGGTEPVVYFRDDAQVIIIKGELSGTIPDVNIGYYQPEEPETSWWDDIKLELLRQLGLTDGGMLYPIVELWEYLFPDENILDYNDIVLITPSPPSPVPTSIPYSTTINPGTGEIQYHYNGITSTLPPPEPTYTITLPPDTGIAMPSGIVYSDDGLQEVIDSIDDNLIEYQSGIETIRDSFSVLPVKWFVFFGIPAAILIIAGVIKSLLG